VVKGIDGTIEERASHRYYPGEHIQFIYSCSKRNRFMLFSLDEQGAFSTYLPAAGDSAITLPRGADLPLPNSILLDEYIGRELFIAVFSERPLAVPTVKSIILKQYAKAGSLDAVNPASMKEFNAHTFLITKAEREQ
jgi:hypothetical protein